MNAGIGMEFLTFLFRTGRRKVGVKALSVERDGGAGSPPTSDRRRSDERATRLWLVTLSAYIIGGVLIVSLTGIVFFAIARPEQAVPSPLRDIFFTSLGYFGGAFAGFLKVK